MFSVCFWVGRSWYKRDIPNRNIVTLFFKCSLVKFIIAAYFMSMISLKHYFLSMHSAGGSTECQAPTGLRRLAMSTTWRTSPTSRQSTMLDSSFFSTRCTGHYSTSKVHSGLSRPCGWTAIHGDSPSSLTSFRWSTQSSFSSASHFSTESSTLVWVSRRHI